MYSTCCVCLSCWATLGGNIWKSKVSLLRFSRFNSRAFCAKLAAYIYNLCFRFIPRYGSQRPGSHIHQSLIGNKVPLCQIES
ncbi:GSCOCG00010074001-RA-CDS [Cotesia congregata]|nr:GSCOCG00010074001-RA-CDS [Cotesia congregata]